MNMHREVAIRTSAREQMVDITQQVKQTVREMGLEDGLAHIYCPHTTAAILIQENADPDLRLDIVEKLAQLVPQRGFRHREGNADAHIKAILCGCSATVPVARGKL
ncbi:MAG: YjbQ family protein, partial [Deltaproteobacteria bacterium]|nr:YjbQ family protein [Deltaproteobacteria bacterium]